MSRTLKWIFIGLAIALGVFLIALPVFYLARHVGSLADWGRGMLPFRTGIVPHFRTISFLGVLPRLAIFGFFRVLLPLVIFGFAVYGVVALVRGRKPAFPPAVPPVPPLPVAPRVCAACGKSLYTDGEFCPYCGVKQV